MSGQQVADIVIDAAAAPDRCFAVSENVPGKSDPRTAACPVRKIKEL
jgi:hypothetical protein